MDVFDALEDRVSRLIASYLEVKDRVATLEQENAALRQAASGADVASLQQRIAALEAERDEVRRRLEQLLSSIEGLEL
ncbi:MAG: cell division protein ZapB [Thermoanaerobaculaceae bacterium]|jgi:hypothetical protein|nr:cell division protein ZapB [Thermoanaerobaculaceae bacterium]